MDYAGITIAKRDGARECFSIEKIERAVQLVRARLEEAGLLP